MTRTFLGQNFLVDEAVQKRIVELFSAQSGEVVVEIGPGKGAITQWLSELPIELLVVEKDPQLVSLHRSKGQYSVVAGDFCDWGFAVDGRDLKHLGLIGNLPYEVGTQILKHICAHADKVEHFLFMLQREVVERICAKPHTSDFGSLSVLLQGQFTMKPFDVISPEAFDPAPKVYSQLVEGKLRPVEQRHPLDKAFQSFVQRSFQNKRKTLKNNWKAMMSLSNMTAVFEEFKIAEKARAEELDVDLWPKAYEFLKTRPAS